MRRYTKEDIGKRITYSDRSGKVRFGTIRGISGVDTSPFVDVKLENMKRDVFYVPEDTVELVPVELQGIIDPE